MQNAKALLLHVVTLMSGSPFLFGTRPVLQ